MKENKKYWLAPIVVTLVLPLATRIRSPIEMAGPFTALQRIPTKQSLYHTDRSNNKEEDEAKYDVGADKSKRFCKHNPSSVRINQ